MADKLNKIKKRRKNQIKKINLSFNLKDENENKIYFNFHKIFVIF